MNTEMTSRTLEFNLAIKDQSVAFAQLCASLNQAGVPFSLRFEQAILRVAITIGEGF